MKKQFKVVLRLMIVAALTALVLFGAKACKIIRGYHETKVIANGPFAARFPAPRPKDKSEIERWFLEQVPLGTPREKAKVILSKSFSADLSSGKMIVIDESGSISGGSSTSVRLHFDKQGYFKAVEIKQHSAYL
jgi:hypothetical protein